MSQFTWEMVGGAHQQLFEAISMTAHESKTHCAQAMRTAVVRYDKVLGGHM